MYRDGMPMAAAIAVIVVVALLAWLIVRIRSPRPEFPPLQTAHDDPPRQPLFIVGWNGNARRRTYHVPSSN